VSRGDVTKHTKEHHGCWYSPYGNRYIPIDPNQLAEGRARKLARQTEIRHRQLRREEAERRERAPDVTCDMLLPRGRGRGILRIYAEQTQTLPAPGGYAHNTPSVGRSSVLTAREPRSCPLPGITRNSYA